MIESLTKSSHSAEFLTRHLQQALTQADPVQALILLPMIERTAVLARDVAALLAAVEKSAK